MILLFNIQFPERFYWFRSLGRLLSSNRKASLVSYLIFATTSGLDNSAFKLSGKKFNWNWGKIEFLMCVSAKKDMAC